MSSKKEILSNEEFVRKKENYFLIMIFTFMIQKITKQY